MQGLFLTQRSVQVHGVLSAPTRAWAPLLDVAHSEQSRAQEHLSSSLSSSFPSSQPLGFQPQATHQPRAGRGVSFILDTGPPSDERVAWSCPVTFPSSLRGPFWHLAHQTTSAWHMWGDPAVLLGVPQSERPFHTSFYIFFLRSMCLKANRRHIYGRCP